MTRGAEGSRWALVLGVAALVALPSATACHVSSTVRTGTVVQETGPAAASIHFPLGACEGTVNVTVEVSEVGGATSSETLQATLAIQQPGVDCLPWDPCSPRFPPAASFTLETDGDGLLLQGVMENTVHTTEVAQLEGTYQGDPASFTILKPI